MTPVSYIHGIQMHGPDSASEYTTRIARSFVTARLEARSLPAFPGEVPHDLDGAYAVQDAAIALWPDTLAGWKVGGIPPAWRERYPAERLVGPIFRRAVRRNVEGEVVELPVFAGGFAAVEAEFILRIAEDAPAKKLQWTPDEAAEIVAALHVGIEPASSPLATLNQLGPAAIVSDFGNNAGLVVGAAIADWARRAPHTLPSATFVQGVAVGRGTAASIEGGPLAALAFALGCCARRGLPLKAGMHVTTGATTGIHVIQPGETARVEFEGAGSLLCRAVAAPPHEGSLASRRTGSHA
jgi:2-keto-4-pentenoate hydratase